MNFQMVTTLIAILITWYIGQTSKDIMTGEMIPTIRTLSPVVVLLTMIVEIYILRDNEIKGRNPSKWLLASWLFLFTAIIIRYKNNLIVDISEVYKVLRYRK